MGSNEFLLALLSTQDKNYKKDFSYKTRFLLSIFKIFFPKYIELAAKTRLSLKNKLIKEVKKLSPKMIIELGSGYSTDYVQKNNTKKSYELIQIDKDKILNSDDNKYKFIQGDISKINTWNKILKLRSSKGIIIAEGLFTYLNDKEFDFVINNISKMLKNNYFLLTHEPIKPISFSRKILSVFIGKTYRRFTSKDQIKDYYALRNLKIKIIESTKWQIIYIVTDKSQNV